jgi:hypothetical protein
MWRALWRVLLAALAGGGAAALALGSPALARPCDGDGVCAFPSLHPQFATSVNGAILPGRRIVSYYGNPLSSALGIMGALPPRQMLDKLQQQADVYTQLDPRRPALPALELITPVAQGTAGADGLYRFRMDDTLIDEVAGWAESRGYLLILDMQIGGSTVAAEIQPLLPYLARPNVELALDPEFAMPAGVTPGAIIGSLDACAINGAISTLDALVQAHQLPPKVLIVHRFTEHMVTNALQIRPTSGVQVAIDMDGFGSPELKAAGYQIAVADEPVQYAGIKLFYTQDMPLMSPADVLAFMPVPDVVIYQ